MTPQERHDIARMRQMDDMRAYRDGLQRALVRTGIAGGLLIGAMAALLALTLFQAAVS